MIKAFANGTLPVANPVRVNDPNNGDNTVSISNQLTINGELDLRRPPFVSEAAAGVGQGGRQQLQVSAVSSEAVSPS